MNKWTPEQQAALVASAQAKQRAAMANAERLDEAIKASDLPVDQLNEARGLRLCYTLTRDEYQALFGE